MFKVNKLFVTWLFALFLQSCGHFRKIIPYNQPIRAHNIGYKQKPYSKFVIIPSCTCGKFLIFIGLAVLLQGIGLSLEEALIFWRAEFTKLMDVDKVFYNKLVPPNSHSQTCHKFGEIKFLDLKTESGHHILTCLCSFFITWPIICFPFLV